MKNLSEFAGETLFIHQPSVWKSYYELKHGDNVLGQISSKGFFGISKIFKLENKEWEIYRPGFWKSEVAIRQAGYELPYATYKRDGLKSHGTVKCYRGEQMIIETKLLRGGYSVKTLSGEILAVLKDKVSIKDKTEITIVCKSELLDKYPWVIVLAWYLSMQRKQAAHAG